MNRGDDLDPKASLSHLLAFYLRKYREDAGMTQSDLAAALCVSERHLGNLERARRRVTIMQARDLDKTFNLPHWFELLHHHAQGEHRDWLAQYSALEAEATELKIWQPLWVPGLLQTKAYAEATMASGHIVDAEEKLASRLARQSILSKDDPPFVWVLLDEKALRQDVGGPEVMREQMDRLLTASYHPSVTLQVVPMDAGSHLGLEGGFIIVGSDEGEAAYVEAQLGGRLIQDESEVKTLGRRYDQIRSLALSVSDTRKKISQIMEDY